MFVIYDAEGRSKEDVLYVDEEIPAVGRVLGAHEGSVCLVQIQVTC